MAEIKSKIVLKKKGEEAYISLKQLRVTLRWSASVDLDLMAFYKTRDGRVGGVFSDNYAGGSMGELNSFPYIALSGDAGVGSKGGDNEEELRITKLDDMAEVYICTINFTDASKDKDSTFSKYDGHVQIVDDKGESIAVPLDSTQSGTVAVIARIDNSGFMGAKLVNENHVIDMSTFRSNIPGASLLKLSSKIVLKSKGDSVQLKTKADGGVGELMVNLNWNQGQPQQKVGFLSKLMGGGGGGGIDLDLGCLYELSDGQKGAIQPLGKSFGAFDRPPYIFHCGDDRTGAWSEGENLRINGNHLADIKRILIYSYIYEGAANWSQANGVVTIKQPGSPDIVVNLDNTQDGVAMCVIALFERSGGTFKVTKVLQYFQGHEHLDKAHNWGLKWVEGKK
ncbi:tellurium resistance protein TerA [Candidatus Magnetobacterium bavaricum]|uniref:Tellurium resistance protein TerA n=1 Tax=Candidatus Magnetobacterium bavaricum TaxID=29290 RepID=A0A0F3GY29_9BACT|nr:tellurium resistance protein TerA [Candidatus Magnetobacterium bavaricum]KJU86765.1 tellurium resistance protein TerA [Candidatus Magnetobacterium bavaricum]